MISPWSLSVNLGGIVREPEEGPHGLRVQGGVSTSSVPIHDDGACRQPDRSRAIQN